MICVEIPLRTLSDEVEAISGVPETAEGCMFAAGAVAALEWVADHTKPSPTSVLLSSYERQDVLQ